MNWKTHILQRHNPLFRTQMVLCDFSLTLWFSLVLDHSSFFHRNIMDIMFEVWIVDQGMLGSWSSTWAFLAVIKMSSVSFRNKQLNPWSYLWECRKLHYFPTRGNRCTHFETPIRLAWSCRPKEFAQLFQLHQNYGRWHSKQSV